MLFVTDDTVISLILITATVVITAINYEENDLAKGNRFE